MANTLYTPEQAARSSLAALRWLTTLPRTVRQDFSAEFVPGRGAVINVRKPVSAGASRTYTSANRTARDAIVFDDLSEATVPVTLDTQVYKAVRLPDDFATFSLQSLETQVLRPQAESVVDGLMAPLITTMQSISTDADVPSITLAGDNVLTVIAKARTELNKRKVPLADRFLAVGSNIGETLIGRQELRDVSQSGYDGTLREAIVGRVYGFTVIEDMALDPNTAIAYHRDAFAFVTRPSRNPEGAAKSATVAQDGFALRWLQHYNPLQLEDQSVVDTFVGADVLDAERAVKITKATV